MKKTFDGRKYEIIKSEDSVTISNCLSIEVQFYKDNIKGIVNNQEIESNYSSLKMKYSTNKKTITIIIKEKNTSKQKCYFFPLDQEGYDYLISSISSINSDFISNIKKYETKYKVFNHLLPFIFLGIPIIVIISILIVNHFNSPNNWDKLSEEEKKSYIRSCNDLNSCPYHREIKKYINSKR